MSDYHGLLMNIHTTGRGDYYEGHRDARHAAAEIGLKADAELESLRSRLVAADEHAIGAIRERNSLAAQLAEAQEQAKVDRLVVEEARRHEVAAEAALVRLEEIYATTVDCWDADAKRLAAADALLREAQPWLEANYAGARAVDARIDAHLGVRLVPTPVADADRS